MNPPYVVNFMYMQSNQGNQKKAPSPFRERVGVRGKVADVAALIERSPCSGTGAINNTYRRRCPSSCPDTGGSGRKRLEACVERLPRPARGERVEVRGRVADVASLIERSSCSGTGAGRSTIDAIPPHPSPLPGGERETNPSALHPRFVGSSRYTTSCVFLSLYSTPAGRGSPSFRLTDKRNRYPAFYDNLQGGVRGNGGDMGRSP